jgi:hypothetical protein
MEGCAQSDRPLPDYVSDRAEHIVAVPTHAHPGSLSAVPPLAVDGTLDSACREAAAAFVATGSTAAKSMAASVTWTKSTVADLDALATGLSPKQFRVVKRATEAAALAQASLCSSGTLIHLI